MNIHFFDTVRASEVTDALEKIIKGGFPRRELFLVTALASGIAGIGLLTDEVVLIIGSMIVAPLLLPLLSVGVGVAALDMKLTLNSLKGVVIGCSVSVLFVIPLALLLSSTDYQNNASYYATIRPSVESALVAGFAGVVSAFAVSKKELSDSMAGVAISVALIPPLAATGIALADLNMQSLLSTAGQFAMNVGLIILTSAIIFRYLDFDKSIATIRKNMRKESRKKKSEEK